MGLPEFKTERRYTYADYLNWPTDGRWEIIDGEAYDMSPAPGIAHQDTVGYIFRIISDFLDGKKCRVFVAPLDVRLPETGSPSGDEIATVVQPDLLVVCDESKIDKKGIFGPPDLAVEVLSESTAYKDETMKFKLYERHGVREFWIVNPEARYLNIFRLESDGRYGKPEHCREDDTFESPVLAGMRIDCSKIFRG